MAASKVKTLLSTRLRAKHVKRTSALSTVESAYQKHIQAAKESDSVSFTVS
jgi:hypothetical protein